MKRYAVVMVRDNGCTVRCYVHAAELAGAKKALRDIMREHRAMGERILLALIVDTEAREIVFETPVSR
jgi:hypothetical protein